MQKIYDWDHIQVLEKCFYEQPLTEKEFDIIRGMSRRKEIRSKNRYKKTENLYKVNIALTPKGIKCLEGEKFARNTFGPRKDYPESIEELVEKLS